MMPVIVTRLVPSRELCGFSEGEFGDLLVRLAPLESARLNRNARRPGRQRAPGAGTRPQPFAIRLLVVLVSLRTTMSGRQLARLVGRDERTLRRWRDEILEVLLDHGVVLPGAPAPARSPEELTEYLRARAEDPAAYVIIDGTHTAAGRPNDWAAHRSTYYWKAHQHAARATVLADERGRALWFEAEPEGRGSPNDWPMLQAQALLLVLALSGITVLADKGYLGLQDTLEQDVWLPRKRWAGRSPSRDERIVDHAMAAARVKVDHGICALKRWGVLRTFRRHRRHYDNTGRAVLTLESLRAN
jgi:hypothetical protein